MTQIDFHVSLTGASRNPIGSKADKKNLYTVGFGESYICKENREVVFDFEMIYASLEEAEKNIQFEPNTKYFLEVNAPLWSAIWERNIEGDWICIESGDGFA